VPIWLALLAAGGPCTAACGASPKQSTFGTADDPNAQEYWQTDEEWRLVAKERCATGPFEIVIPAREFEFGRRIVLSVHGERGFELNRRMDFADGSTMSGRWAVSASAEDEHAHCRVREEELAHPVAADNPPAAVEHRPEPEGALAPPGPGDSGDKGPSMADGPVPELVPFTGQLNQSRWVPRSAWAWFPLGNPMTKTDVGISWQVSDEARSGFRLRLWFSKPTDTAGMVLVITDQRLVPKGPLAEYRAQLAGRVAAANAQRGQDDQSQGLGAVTNDDKCARNPDLSWCWPVGRVPPRPKNQERPPEPAPNVAWLPGYWSFDRGVDDFVWISGTFVVRERAGAAAVGQAGGHSYTSSPTSDKPAAPSPSPAVRPAAAPPTEVEQPPAKPVVVPPDIPPQPEPKHETIPPPPVIAGVVWVAGYWELKGTTWNWIAGEWRTPQRKGARFRAPSIGVRGKVRVYVPGGWVTGRP
jgi:hypothetical protein